MHSKASSRSLTGPMELSRSRECLGRNSKVVAWVWGLGVHMKTAGRGVKKKLQQHCSGPAG